MKDDEAGFMFAVAMRPAGADVRDVIRMQHMHYKRCWYLLEKWARKGWYDYGVTLDLGWLTPKGFAEIKVDPPAKPTELPWPFAGRHSKEGP